MVMMAEQGKSRKQCLLSALSHISRQERNRKGITEIISVPAFKKRASPSSLRGFFSYGILCKTKKTHLHPQDSY